MDFFVSFGGIYAINHYRLMRIITLLLAVVLAGCVKEGGSDAKEKIRIGDEVPVFTVDNWLTGDDFRQYSSTELVGVGSTKMPTLIVFFNSTCPDCQREMPKIQQVYDALPDYPDFRLVTIGRDETPASVEGYWNSVDGSKGKGTQFTMPWYVDPDREVYNMFADTYIPRLYLVDTNGKVVWKAVEKLDITTGELIAMIEEMID